MLLTRAKLLGSFITFLCVFYELKNGRPFIVYEPIGRESHIKTIIRELKLCFKGEENRLVINCPPGYGKSTILVYFVAWCYANYGDCNFLYISYSSDLATKHTSTIKEIMEMPLYTEMFGVKLRTDSKAKGLFKTQNGGTCAAFGAAGSVTGQDAGLPNELRCTGGVIIDDSHKPDEVHSPTLREKVITNYKETIKQRPRGPNVFMIFIGQRLHEEDLANYLITGQDGYQWKTVILKALDDAGNALCPELNSLEKLKNEQETNRYVFASQFQQNPIPAGGGLFKRSDFVLTDDVPEIISTFMSCDTAETIQSYNDASVFSFFGLYKLKHRDIETALYGLHWIDCRELRVEPKDLESEFYDFYSGCMRFPIKPNIALIEKKSTGVTLCSILKNIQGVRIIEVTPTGAAQSKTNRFIDCQKYIAAKHISLTKDAIHTEKAIEHCCRITANNSHAHDDIMDTLSQIIKMTLIDGTLLPKSPQKKSDILNSLNSQIARGNALRRNVYGTHR